ncbi:hypothetical protein D515_03172 [Grimontia indica]|uniref:Uncharacterized protein n=1 Tax=Grimontia indica TaxID=1056512 RepID=R1GPR4_9GAMM|nr:hypothetical protein [Grimontia indica]EOD78049.1 hypothetical protein D515_03172 [Grimontia indica]
MDNGIFRRISALLGGVRRIDKKQSDVDTKFGMVCGKQCDTYLSL